MNRAGLPETGACTAQRRGQGSKTAAGRQRTTAGQCAPTLTPRTACYGEGNSKTPLHPHTSRAPGQAQRAGSAACRRRQGSPPNGRDGHRLARGNARVARRRQPGRPNPWADKPSFSSKNRACQKDWIKLQYSQGEAHAPRIPPALPASLPAPFGMAAPRLALVLNSPCLHPLKSEHERSRVPGSAAADQRTRRRSALGHRRCVALRLGEPLRRDPDRGRRR